MELTKEFLQDYYDYDRENGHLLHKGRNYNRATVGTRAGSLGQSGYWFVSIKNKTYRAHRVIWIMHNGPIPPLLVIDHIDGNKINNRLDNLRLATERENRLAYQPPHKWNKSGFRGVHLDKKSGRWTAQISISLGAFSSPQQAAQARADAINSQWYNLAGRSLQRGGGDAVY
jgi:hypothetical protein